MNGLAALVFMGMGFLGGLWFCAVSYSGDDDDDQSELAWYRLHYPMKWDDQ